MKLLRWVLLGFIGAVLVTSMPTVQLWLAARSCEADGGRWLEVENACVLVRDKAKQGP